MSTALALAVRPPHSPVPTPPLRRLAALEAKLKAKESGPADGAEAGGYPGYMNPNVVLQIADTPFSGGGGGGGYVMPMPGMGGMGGMPGMGMVPPPMGMMPPPPGY